MKNLRVALAACFVLIAPFVFASPAKSQTQNGRSGAAQQAKSTPSTTNNAGGVGGVGNDGGDFRKRVAAKVGKADFRGAVNELNDVIMKDPSNAAAYFIRAEMHVQLRDVAAAARDYDAVIRLQPTNQQGYFMRAMLRSDAQSDYVGAIADWTSALRLDSTNAEYWFYRGNAYEQRKQFDSAEHDYTACLRTSSTTNTLALVRRGVCLAALKKPNDALKDFSAAIAVAPSFDAFFQRGNIFVKQRRNREAVADFDAALRINDQSAESYYLRGYAKLASGSPEGGCVDLAQAREMGFEPAKKLIDENCDYMPNLDSLRRFTMPEVTVTAKRSREDVAVRDSRSLIGRVANFIVNPPPPVFSSLSGVENTPRQMPPGTMSAFDCNKTRLSMSRPSQINVYCVVQVLQDELRTVKDATVQAMMRDLLATANDLFIIESAESGMESTMASNLRVRMSQQMRELNEFLGKLQGK